MKRLAKYFRDELRMISRFSIWEKEGWCYLPLKEETEESVGWCFLRGGEENVDDALYSYLALA